MPFLAICPKASLKIHERAPSYEEQVLLFVPEDLLWRGCNSRYLRKSICSNQSGCVAGSLFLSSHGRPVHGGVETERERERERERETSSPSASRIYHQFSAADEVCGDTQHNLSLCQRYTHQPAVSSLLSPALRSGIHLPSVKNTCHVGKLWNCSLSSYL